MVVEAKRLRALESQNARLKKLLSERTLQLDALQDVLSTALAGESVWMWSPLGKKYEGLPAAESSSKPWFVTGACRFTPVAA